MLVVTKMRKRIALPYLLTIILFVILYGMTQLLPVNHFRMCPECAIPKWNKLAVQMGLFTVGLTVVILLINLYQIVTVKKDDFTPRFWWSLATIIVVYGWNSLLYRLFVQSFDFYNAPAFLYGIVTFMVVNVGLLVLDGMKAIVFKIYQEDKIKARLPEWLRET
jgi:hypothetical protein